MREAMDKNNVFSHDKVFYRNFFGMMILLVLQNIVTYTLNVLDNVILGAYSQTALSAAAAVNQIQYILQQFTVMGLGEGVVIFSGQFWGKKDTAMIRKVFGSALICGLIAAFALTTAAFLVPAGMVGLFTDDPEVIREGVSYLSIIRYTYPIFIVLQLLLSMLRSMQVVRIAFQVSCVGLLVNSSLNYCLIYGKFGFPEMGIHGAAIGTLAATATELVIVLFVVIRKGYLRPSDLPEALRVRGVIGRYLRVSLPCVVSAIIFSSAVAVQTAIFGHLSTDALAASGVAGTFFQYTKMIPIGAAAASCALISQTVGKNDMEKLPGMVHSLQLIYFLVGLLTCVILLAIRTPVLSVYKLTETAYHYAWIQMTIQAIISIGMSFQMPEQTGIIRGGGDTRYSMISDLIYSWGVVVPLSMIVAFVFHAPFGVVVFCLNVDQLLKCITVTHKVRSWTWVKHLV